MAEITKLLGIAINDYDEGRLSATQLLSIFQESIDNGDILLPDNEFYMTANVIPLIDQGILKPSQYSDEFESRMNAKATALAAKLRRDKSRLQ